MAQKYSLGNSLSPMMFRRGKNKGSKGSKETEGRKDRSRSLDDILAADFEKVKSKSGKGKCEEGAWEEVASVSAVAPVVMCILPPLSADFVSSAVMAVGATPLLTDGKRGEGGGGARWFARGATLRVLTSYTLLPRLRAMTGAARLVVIALYPALRGSSEASRVITASGPALVAGEVAI